MEEAFVSYEVAKLLKEKGFDPNWVKGSKCTHQMAMAWLRKKGILLWVYPIIPIPIKDNRTFRWRWTGKRQRHDAPHFDAKCSYETYEEAVESAISYALKNLI